MERTPFVHAPIAAIVAALACFSCSGAAVAASAADPAFDREVKPILAKHCIDCHGGKHTKAGLNLTSVDAMRKGADSGPVIVPGKSGQSLMAQLVTADGDPHMPPKGQLTDAEIATLAKWIDGMQAEAPVAKAIDPAAREHWAFRKPVRSEPPQVKDAAWVRTPIDAFILAGLEARGLKPAPPAGRAELIRRATFDLTGLPATPDEVKAFVADDAPDAYEKLIDRLLASPRYGERWGRHWLDLARYADSGGFHNDLDRPHAWRYRDYVIRSFNADKPYGQFAREQLAGDEIAPQDADALAATGFCRNGPSNEDNMGKNALDKERYRLEELDDVISTTSAVFMGLTLGCARCHDHKYDPLPQTDYYRFLAFFNTTVKKDVPLGPDGAPLLTGAASRDDKGKSPHDKAAAVMVMTDSGNKPRTTKMLWRGDAANPGPEVEPGVPVVLVDGPIDVPAAAKDAKTTGRRTMLADWLVSPDNPLTWRVVANRLWQHHFGRGLVATPSNFGLGGERPSHPELLDWLATETVRHEGRLKAMHKLIMTSAAYRQSSAWNEQAAAADPENALVWRMSKRRLEAEAVRDAVLAVAGTLNEQMGGPGIKPRVPADMLEASQRNKWPAVAKEGPQHWRRSVYIYVKRQLQFPMLELLDAPTSTQTCADRQESTVPTQALLMMNDEFVNDQAGYFADRVTREAGADPAAQAERALWLALSRPPEPERVARAVAFMKQQQAMHAKSGSATAQRMALVDLCHVLLNCNEFAYVD